MGATTIAMSHRTPKSEPADGQAVAAYVASLSADLATMARRSGLETLGYLLDMVHLEANNATRHGPDGSR